MKSVKPKNEAAIALGRLGGLKTASKMTKDQIIDRAKKASDAAKANRKKTKREKWDMRVLAIVLTAILLTGCQDRTLVGALDGSVYIVQKDGYKFAVYNNGGICQIDESKKKEQSKWKT